MVPIEVTARFFRDGNIIPKDFYWQNTQYPVISTGRHWQDEKGYHILVMTPGELVHELIFLPAELCWYLNNLGSYRNTT